MLPQDKRDADVLQLIRSKLTEIEEHARIMVLGTSLALSGFYFVCWFFSELPTFSAAFAVSFALSLATIGHAVTTLSKEIIV